MSDQNKQKRALVLFSGGQDSSLCLAWALDRFEEVETLSFDYGQRHIVELEAGLMVRKHLLKTFPVWAKRLGTHHELSLPALHAISDTALTREQEIVLGDNGLPTSFVPGRNLLFFTYAAALAYRRGMRHLAGGMCETDYSGYPDCRQETLEALENAINLGMAADFKLHTPLMHQSKAQSWMLARAIGGEALVDIIRLYSHSCYLGEQGLEHDWGYGCGTCPACRLRARGYALYMEQQESQGARQSR